MSLVYVVMLWKHLKAQNMSPRKFQKSFGKKDGAINKELFLVIWCPEQ